MGGRFTNMKSRKKTPEGEKPKSKNCSCAEPDLIERIDVGYYGFFCWCKKCGENRRLKPIYKNNNLIGFE